MRIARGICAAMALMAMAVLPAGARIIRRSPFG